MKNVLGVLLLSVASIAQVNAASGNSYVDSLKAQSFSELRANYDVDFENDQTWFGGRIVSVLDTCMLDEETVRTLNKVTIEEYDGEEFEVVGYDYLTKSIHGTKAMVDGDDVIDVPYTMSTTREIKVVQMDDDFDGDLLFTRDFTIPSCN